jgi:hypothetical protein
MKGMRQEQTRCGQVKADEYCFLAFPLLGLMLSPAPKFGGVKNDSKQNPVGLWNEFSPLVDRSFDKEPNQEMDE